MYDFENVAYGIEFYNGTAILTEKNTGNVKQVTLRDTKTGRNITRQQFISGAKKAKVDRVFDVFWKLAK
jgi:hypothetical protein